MMHVIGLGTHACVRISLAILGGIRTCITHHAFVRILTINFLIDDLDYYFRRAKIWGVKALMNNNFRFSI